MKQEIKIDIGTIGGGSPLTTCNLSIYLSRYRLESHLLQENGLVVNLSITVCVISSVICDNVVTAGWTIFTRQVWAGFGKEKPHYSILAKLGWGIFLKDTKININQ